MHPVPRFLLRRLRQLGEAILFWPVLIILSLMVAGLVLAKPAWAWRRRRDLRELLARWGSVSLRGLQEGRATWWELFEHEGAWSVARYLLLLEVFRLINLFASSRPWDGAAPQRILVAKFGHFGDTLHAVPMLRALREAYPDSALDLVTGPWCADLAKRIPYVDHVHVYRPAIYSMHRGNPAGRRTGFGEWRFLWSLRKRSYDLMIVTYRTGLIDLVLLEGVRPRAWLGPAPERDRRPTSSSHIPVRFDSDVYDAERLLSMLSPLGIQNRDASLEFWIRSDEETKYQRLLNRHGLNKAAGWLICCPGSGWPGKNWPAERYARFADWWIEKYAAPVLLCGGPDERALSERVRSAMKRTAIDLTGETSWGELACLIRDALLLAGNDSGPMHLAAVYQTPTVTFWGPTSPTLWAPRGSMHRVMRKVENCPGCLYWHPAADCVRDHYCMNQISVDEAINAVQQLDSCINGRISP